MSECPRCGESFGKIMQHYSIGDCDPIDITFFGVDETLDFLRDGNWIRQGAERDTVELRWVDGWVVYRRGRGDGHPSDSYDPDDPFIESLIEYDSWISVREP